MSRPSTTAQTSQTTSSTPQVQLPPEQEVPTEPPPPYTPSDPEHSVDAGPSSYNPYNSYPAAASASSAAPPHAPPQSSRPPPTPSRPPPTPQRPNNGKGSHAQAGYPGNYTNSNQYNRYSSPGPSGTYGHPHQQPPPGAFPGPMYPPPPQGPPGHPSHPMSPQAPPTGPRPPFQYPPGFWCYKCNNTGIKLKNGKTCQDCYARFARPNTNIPMPSYGGGSLWNPMSYVSSVPAGPGTVVRPGDPRIGGILCGRCRGRGYVTDFLFEDTCPTCRGIGRLLQ
uniref:ARAD1D07458p n=1 Tax=Blastobotrys adeninivorans TaxID=409370 RepID=A0A060TDJ7_BLAAD